VEHDREEKVSQNDHLTEKLNSKAEKLDLAEADVQKLKSSLIGAHSEASTL